MSAWATVAAMTTDELRALMFARAACADGRAKNLRIQAGLSFRELGKVADLNPSTIAKWESGSRVPHGEIGIRYGRTLSSLDELVQAVSA